jgi:TPP-dependent 2-oxoacid decarboxylase
MVFGWSTGVTEGISILARDRDVAWRRDALVVGDGALVFGVLKLSLQVIKTGETRALS